MDNIGQQYPELISEIMKFILRVKKEDPSQSLIDIIHEYSFKNEIDIELIGDAISEDVYFKSFIEKDLQFHTKTNDDW